MTKCNRTGCRGQIEDGFCTDCGLAPVGVTHLPANPIPAVSANMSAPASSNPGSDHDVPRSSATAHPSWGVVPVLVGGIKPLSSGRGLVSASSSAPGSTLSSARTGSRGRSTASKSTGRALGAGFISLPPLQSMDPMQSVMAMPAVPERKRFCGSCQKKVSRESGFCAHCGKPYSFEPTLKAGDLVGGQYEVKGPIAFGGLGWIYLGQDRKLTQRWVVLKGLLNSKDEASAGAAVQEREFLSAVKHPNIVGIYNFASHGNDGYIVMEYVGGKSLNEIRKERGPLPPAEAIAYMHRILPAFAYLHELGMVYCDFKPPNVMFDDDVKLIDMGGVRKVDDKDGDVYGTKGFFAPEVGAKHSPSFVSDLYTIARTLAVLTITFDFQDKYQYSLPLPVEEPVFARHDSLYRFLLKATRANPDERFQTAGEMAEQLLGVLRDAAAFASSSLAPPRIVESSIFGGDRLEVDDDHAALTPGAHLLPVLKVDASDPAANAILACADTEAHKRAAFLERTVIQFPSSIEARMRLADTFIGIGSYAVADKQLDEVQARDPFDWRVLWYRGRSLLLRGKTTEAYMVFEHIYDELPGELGSKLACAISAEMAGFPSIAARIYDLIVRCDASFNSASFGLARCVALSGDRNGAAAAYGRVPASSRAYTAAQIALARILMVPQSTEDELAKASEIIKALSLTGLTLHLLRANLLLEAADRLENRKTWANSSIQILDQPLQSKRLRLAAERELRACARFASTVEERMRLVDRANKERPFTVI